MYAVIFKARIKQLDESYQATADCMRRIAKERYGCRGIVSISEDDYEITISYWDQLEQIEAWRQDAEHIAAQEEGRERWYQWIQIQVVDILRDYDMTFSAE